MVEITPDAIVFWKLGPFSLNATIFLSLSFSLILTSTYTGYEIDLLSILAFYYLCVLE